MLLSFRFLLKLAAPLVAVDIGPSCVNILLPHYGCMASTLAVFVALKIKVKEPALVAPHHTFPLMVAWIAQIAKMPTETKKISARA
jgi:hypothetical protein